MISWRWLCLVPPIVALACDQDYCAEACNDLATCGLLPSPLGVSDDPDGGAAAGRDDCISRCSASKSDAVIQFAVCTNVTSGFAAGPGWCTVPSGADYRYYDRDVPDGAPSATFGGVPNSQCDNVARCVDTTFGPYARGRANIEIGIVTGDAGRLDSDLSCNVGGLSPPPVSGGAGLPFAAADDFCTLFGADEAHFFLEQNGQRTEFESDVCASGLAVGSLSAAALPGPAILGVRLSGEGGATACWTFYTRRTVLPAGPGVTIVDLDLPDPDGGTSSGYTGCEQTYDACRDGKDNDEDGLVDCDDGECIALSLQGGGPDPCARPTTDAGCDGGSNDAAAEGATDGACR